MVNGLQWLAAFLLASANGGVDVSQPVGIWRNAKDSVHIEIRRCAEAICGKVIWANDKAKADARKGGTDPLVGAELLREFRQDRKGRWRGKVFVPDIGQTFHGTIALLDANSLKARGCLFVGIVCKSRIWTRVR
jgi:uncharacterized protein (DUF2147 family)